MMSIDSNAVQAEDAEQEMPTDTIALGDQNRKSADAPKVFTAGPIKPKTKREPETPQIGFTSKKDFLGMWPVKSAGLSSLSLDQTLLQYQQESERRKARKLTGNEIMSGIAATQHVRKKHTVIYADTLRSVRLQKQLLGLCLQMGGSGKNYMVRPHSAALKEAPKMTVRTRPHTGRLSEQVEMGVRCSK